MINVSVSSSVFNVANATCGSTCPTCLGYNNFGISPGSQSTDVGGTLSYNAIAINTSGGAAEVRQMRTPLPFWSSSNTNVATSQGQGSFSAVSPGSFSADASVNLIDANADCPEGQHNPCPTSQWSASGSGTVNPTPDHLKIVSDQIVGLSSCPTTKNRLISYQEVDSRNNPVSTISTEETFTSISTNTCNNPVQTSSTCSPDANGQFTDNLTVGCNSVGGSCGFTALHQQWLWCKPSGGTQVLATPGDLIVHNDSISVGGSTATRSAGTCVYADGSYALPCR